MTQKLLIAGCGDLGIAFGALMHSRGREVWGLRREAGKLPAEIKPWRADVTDIDSLRAPPTRFDELVISLTTRDRTPDGYQKTYVQGVRNLAEALRENGSTLQRAIFCSSTVVYGTDDASWVNENSRANPTNFRGELLLEAEAEVLTLAPHASNIRLAGIYGRQSPRILKQIIERTLEPENKFTNRIHFDDCVHLLAQVLELPKSERCYLGVDHEPTNVMELVDWVCEQLSVQRFGIPSPSASPTGKRCSNARLLASGFTFRFPNFRVGYAPYVEELRREARS